MITSTKCVLFLVLRGKKGDQKGGSLGRLNAAYTVRDYVIRKQLSHQSDSAQPS